MPDPNLRAILHVDMDAFYASVEQHDDPALRGRAVIVGGLGRRGVVSAASYEARVFGVHSAMPMLRARQLAPAACYVRPRMARYREVSAQVFAVFHDLTPLVEGLSLDEAFLDVTGSLRLFGSREAIGERIRARILADTGLQASVGMAHNKFLAKLASDVRKPAGFVSVDPERVAAFLDPMPLGRLWGIGRKTLPRLQALGLLTIGQFRRADPRLLATVLGNRTGHYLALARGEDERAVSAERPDQSISHEMTFEHDLVEARELLAKLLRQTEAVCRRLRRQQLAARTVTVKIRDHQFRTVTRSLTLRAATQSTRGVYQAGKGLLLSWLGEHRNTPVRLVGIGLSQFEEAGPEQLASGAGRLDAVLDRISEKFGAGGASRGLGLARRK